jgi:hypothetical protein
VLASRWPGAVMSARAACPAGRRPGQSRGTAARRSACAVMPGRCQPRLVRNSAIAAYWHAAAAQTQA